MERMTIAETCEALRISRWTFRRLVQAGEITAVKQDPDVRNSPVDVDAASVRDYIDRHTVPAHDTTEDPLMSSEGTTRRLMTLEEVSEETGLSLRTLQDMCREKKIRHLRPGKFPLMTREHIDDLIDRFTVEPEEPADEADEDRAHVSRLAAHAT